MLGIKSLAAGFRGDLEGNPRRKGQHVPDMMLVSGSDLPSGRDFNI